MRPATSQQTELAGRWMLLIHQIPPKPAYLRVKVGRHLQRLCAVEIKNSVYALPLDDETIEDLQWVRREIVRGGGDASLVEARFVDGLTDEQVTALFHEARTQLRVTDLNSFNSRLGRLAVVSVSTINRVNKLHIAAKRKRAEVNARLAGGDAGTNSLTRHLLTSFHP